MPKIVFQTDIGIEEKKSRPTPTEIRERAFEIHIERGGIHGRELDDWLQAEHELQNKYENGQMGAKDE